MTDTPYTPEDIDEVEATPQTGAPAVEPDKRDYADDFDPGSPAADAPATF